jgi:hypothetical protein
VPAGGAFHLKRQMAARKVLYAAVVPLTLYLVRRDM